MSKLLRGLYRIFIKNRLIRWAWMLGLTLWGVKVATERGLAWKKAPLSKTVMSLPSSNILTFSIRKNEDDETTFTYADTGWLAVKNNVTLRLPTDSMAAYLAVFEKMEAIDARLLTPEQVEKLKPKFHFDVLVTQKNNAKQSFSVYYTDRDSFSNGLLTYIKFANENTLRGIKGDLVGIFGRDFDDFRDKTILDFNKDSALVLTIKSAVDSFSFIRNEKNWVSRNPKFRILPNEFRSYLANLEILRGGKFYDEDRDVLTAPKIEKQLFIYTPSDTIILTSYRLEKGFILHSSQNKEAYFRVDSTTNVFPNLKQFLVAK
jgi:hypothetical protein